VIEQYLGLVSLLVREYDEALAFFVGKLGFKLLEERIFRQGRSAGSLLPHQASECQEVNSPYIRSAQPACSRRIPKTANTGLYSFDPPTRGLSRIMISLPHCSALIWPPGSRNFPVPWPKRDFG
jgi:hypothetical protein